jgi:hypothetical protein
MITVRLTPWRGASETLIALGYVAMDHPGGERLTVLVGERRMTLGDPYSFDGSPECLLALGELGDVQPTNGGT